MKNNSKTLLMIVGLLILTSCFRNINMTSYQKMPKIKTIEGFKKNYGETVKLFGVLEKGTVQNKDVVVVENVFYIRLSDDELILLPEKHNSPMSPTDLMLNNLERLIGKEVFVIGQLNRPKFPTIYEGIVKPSITPTRFITAVDEEYLARLQLTDLKTINIHRKYMEEEDSFFGYVVGTTTQKIGSNETYPLTTTMLLQDKTPFDVTIDRASDIDILGYVGEKIFVIGEIKTKIDEANIIDARISNYEKYMDYHSVD